MKKKERVQKQCLLCGISFFSLDCQKRKFCSANCFHNASRKSIGLVKLGFFQFGNKHPNWKGGLTNINSLIRSSFMFANWRTSVFVRDGFKCIECQSRKEIHPHHIKHLSKIIKEHSIRNLDEARYCRELWDINNGKTLCSECHQKQHPQTHFSFRRKNIYKCDFCFKNFKKSTRNKPQGKHVFCSKKCFGKFFSKNPNSGCFKKGVFYPSSRNCKKL